jgi:hypothetical protein
MDGLSDEEILKKVQPGYTSDTDKYYIELAHWILDKAGHVDIKDPAVKSLEDAEVEYQYAKDDFDLEPTEENKSKMVQAEIAMLKAQIAETKAKLGRSTDFKADKSKEYKSSFGVKGNIGGRLKTRKHKNPNGSTRIRRHYSRRLFGRKIKA